MTGIFKAYDIRGIYKEQLDEDIAYRIGRAFAVFSGAKKIVVARDMRTSSPSLFEALARGVTDQGADVVDLGMATTPQFYFCSGFYKFDAGIMVTASHNPGKYNGFKMTVKGTVPVGYETGIDKIEKMANENKFPEPEKKGEITKKEFMDDYKKLVTEGISKFQSKVVIDTANAMGVKEAEIIQDFCEVVPMYFELDPSFPNHEANPLKYETLKDLQKKVVEEKADIGIAFDGDADRCAFVDENGEIIPSDLITALLARKFPGEKVGYDLRSSKVVAEEIKKTGGTPMITKVGHALIKKQMREENAAFSGEVSGHYYFRETFFCESSIKVCFMILELISGGKKISELINPLKRYVQSGEINSEVENKEAVLKKVEGKYGDAKEILHLDGVSVMFDDWWCNVRMSNTESLVRLNLEADTKELMEEKRDEILKIIRE